MVCLVSSLKFLHFVPDFVYITPCFGNKVGPGSILFFDEIGFNASEFRECSFHLQCFGLLCEPHTSFLVRSYSMFFIFTPVLTLSFLVFITSFVYLAVLWSSSNIFAVCSNFFSNTPNLQPYIGWGFCCIDF